MGEVIPSPEPEPHRTTSSVQLEAVGHKVSSNSALTVIVGAAVAIATAFFGYLSKAKGEDVEQRIETVRAADENAHREMRQDIRDLYQTIMIGRPSERLERPVDAGKP